LAVDCRFVNRHHFELEEAGTKLRGGDEVPPSTSTDSVLRARLRIPVREKFVNAPLGYAQRVREREHGYMMRKKHS